MVLANTQTKIEYERYKLDVLLNKRNEFVNIMFAGGILLLTSYLVLRDFTNQIETFGFNVLILFVVFAIMTFGDYRHAQFTKHIEKRCANLDLLYKKLGVVDKTKVK